MKNIAIVVVLVIAVATLLRLLAPQPTGDSRGVRLQQLNNMRQLYLAVSKMATDGRAQGKAELDWPGELTAGPQAIETVSGLFQRLIKYGYLSASDVEKLTRTNSARSFILDMPGWSVAHPDADKNCAFKVYRVKASDGTETIAFATRNFTYGKDLDPTQMSLGNRPYAFALVRKGGDGGAYKKQQVRTLETLGLLPGRRDFADRPMETPDDILVQR